MQSMRFAQLCRLFKQNFATKAKSETNWFMILTLPNEKTSQLLKDFIKIQYSKSYPMGKKIKYHKKSEM